MNIRLPAPVIDLRNEVEIMAKDLQESSSSKTRCEGERWMEIIRQFDDSILDV